MGGALGFPLVSPLGAPASSPASRAVRDVFGTDMYFSANGFETTPAGDYAEVTGAENLRRAILRRLITAPGAYRLFPEYGCGLLLFVKKPLTTSALDDMQQRIVENLSQERRIQRVLEVSVTRTTFGDQTGVSVLVRVEALGRTLNFAPFNFRKEIG